MSHGFHGYVTNHQRVIYVFHFFFLLSIIPEVTIIQPTFSRKRGFFPGTWPGAAASLGMPILFISGILVPIARRPENFE